MTHVGGRSQSAGADGGYGIIQIIQSINEIIDCNEDYCDASSSGAGSLLHPHHDIIRIRTKQSSAAVTVVRISGYRRYNT